MGYMRRASISVYIATALLVAMIGALVGFMLLSRNHEQLARVLAAEAASVLRVRAMTQYERLADSLITNLRTYLFTQDAAWLRRFEDSRQDLKRRALEIHALLQDSPAQQQRLADMDEQLRHWFDEVAASLRGGTTPFSVNQFVARQDALMTTLGQLSHEFHLIESQRQHAREPQFRETVHRMEQIFSGLAAIIIMGLLVVWRCSLGAIRRPLQLLQQSLQSVAKGGDAPRLSPEKLPGEFHGLVDAYHRVCNHLVEKADAHSRELEKLNQQLLRGIIPICSKCKKIRTERGQWVQVENYIHSRTRADFTHALCEDCLRNTLSAGGTPPAPASTQPGDARG
jgi:CHASE3 domain sensor protein